MIYILIVIISLLSLAIVGLCISFSKTKRDHAQKVDELQYVIVQLTANNENQLGQLKLSDELRHKLYAARVAIDKDLMAMQHDFIGKLSGNNLID